MVPADQFALVDESVVDCIAPWWIASPWWMKAWWIAPHWWMRSWWIATSILSDVHRFPQLSWETTTQLLCLLRELEEWA